MTLETEYQILLQVAKELQIAWINDAFGEQVPLNQLDTLAEKIIKERMDELRRD